MLPRAADRQPGSARQLGSAEHFTDHGNSAAARQVRVRDAWQQGGDPLIGSNGAVRGMPAGAAAGRRAHCNLWSARAHSRPTYATVPPATIDGIRAHKPQWAPEPWLSVNPYARDADSDTQRDADLRIGPARTGRTLLLIHGSD